uniref:Lysosomal acid phosphatase n=1 Tax=Fundulus heteroclitus TaxID=8078 RepID=A0A3Q2P2U5_FUNHE
SMQKDQGWSRTQATVLNWSVLSGYMSLLSSSQLFRHGDRSPVKAYPTDPYKEDAWPQGFGQLSQEGMRQHYELGQFLRTRYKNFLNESYHRHEVLVRSTDYDRTLMSAEANLAGLYPPKGRQMFRPGLKWQPIPVHTVPQSEERVGIGKMGFIRCAKKKLQRSDSVYLLFLSLSCSRFLWETVLATNS